MRTGEILRPAPSTSLAIFYSSASRRGLVRWLASGRLSGRFVASKHPNMPRSAICLYRVWFEAVSWGSAKGGLGVLNGPFNPETSRDELLRNFRGGLYAYDRVMVIGAYRDMHPHRRCHQFRQSYTVDLGFATP